MVDSKHSLHGRIRNLVPVNRLPTEFQDQIAARAEIIGCRKGRYVFQQGERDGYVFYLIEGCIDLYADDRFAGQVVAGTERAQYPLAQLQPRQFSAKAKTAVQVLRLEHIVLDKWLTMEQQREDDSRATAAAELAEERAADWMTCMLQSAIFSRIPAANIQRIFACMEEVQVTTGDVIVRQGSPGDFYYIVREGRCVVTYAPSTVSKPIILAELRAGDSFGEEALVANATRNATVTMLTDGRLMRLTKGDFLELIKKPTVESVSLAEGQAMVQQGALWLDVRFPEEYRYASLPGSINLPLNLLRARMNDLQPVRKYVVYCDTGSRGAAGAFLLAQHGFEVAHLAGGLTQSPLSEGPLGANIQQVPDQQADDWVPEDVRGCGTEQAGDGVCGGAGQSRDDRDKGLPSGRKAIDEATGASVAPILDVRVSELKAELSRVNLQLEEALRLKTRADSERREAVEQAESRVRWERERLGKENVRASEAFSEAQRLRKQLEDERKKGEEAAAIRRQEQDILLRQLEEKTAQRIREQEAKLEAEANEQLEEIVRLTAEADKAKFQAAEEVKRSLERERCRLEDEMARKREAEENQILELRAQVERRFQEQQAKREQEVEKRLNAALKLKAEAEAAKRSEELAIEERLREERQRIEEKAKQASEALADAQRLKRELEKAKRMAEEEAARKQAEEEARVRQVTEEADTRLRSEQRRLQEEYARHAEELARFQEEKDRAQAQWEEEKRKLEAETAEARRSASEIKAKEEKLEESRRCLEEDLQRMRFAHETAEQRLRRELAEKLALERQRLEAEFASNIEAMEQLRQQKLAAEAAKYAAVREAERLTEQQMSGFEVVRQDAEAERDKQQEGLESETRLLKEALSGTWGAGERLGSMGPQNEVHSNSGAAGFGLDKGGALALRGKYDQPNSGHENLGELLEREMKEWLSEQGNLPPNHGYLTDSEAKWQLIKSRADAAKKAAQDANTSLLSEVATQLSRDDK